MKPLLALAALLIAAATLWYVRRPHDREYRATTIARRESAIARPASDRYLEPDDGIQPFDPRTSATGLWSVTNDRRYRVHV